MKTVYILRHGQTVDNVNRIIQGQYDSPLTENGKISIRERAEKLKNVPFDAVYCSPLERAKTSLDIILEEIMLSSTISYKEEIKELDFGTLSKKAIDDVKDIVLKHKRNTEIPYLDGESGDIFKERVMGFMENSIFENKGSCFLVVTHFGVLETLLSHYVGLQYNDIKTNMDNIAWLSFNRKEIKHRWIR